MTALWSDKPQLMPPVYRDYVLCVKMFHCTPRELEQQDAQLVEALLAVWNAEQLVEKQRAKMQAAQQSSGGARGGKTSGRGSSRAG